MQKKPHWSQFDEKLIFYVRLAKDVATQASSRDIDFIHINLVPLQSSIEHEAISWVNAIGNWRLN